MNSSAPFFLCFLMSVFCGREIDPCFNEEPSVSFRFSLIYKDGDHHDLAVQSYSYCLDNDSASIIREIEVLGSDKIIEEEIVLCGYTDIRLPINLHADSVVILFKRDLKTDTLKIKYDLEYEYHPDCGKNVFARNIEFETTLLTKDEPTNFFDSNGEEIDLNDYYYLDFCFTDSDN